VRDEGSSIRRDDKGSAAISRDVGCGAEGASGAEAHKEDEWVTSWLNPRPTKLHASFSEPLEEALLLLFLAGDAVAGPGNGLEALLLKLLMAGDTFAEGTVADAREGVVHQLQQRAVVVRLPEEKFLRVRVGRLVGEIHGGIFVGFAALLFGARDAAQEFLAARGQLFLVIFEPFFIHVPVPQRAEYLNQIERFYRPLRGLSNQ